VAICVAVCAAIVTPTALGSVRGLAPRSQPDDVYRVQIWTQGQGTVTSTPAGIKCPGACMMTVRANTTVVLKVRPAKGWKFQKWYRLCKGTKLSCEFVPGDGVTIVAAAFKQTKKR
jgi:hypothetical protein